MRINGCDVSEPHKNFIRGQDYLNRIGKTSYLQHDIIPEQNNGKEYYVFCINSFI